MNATENLRRDARLVAAAPDLLEALKMLFKHCSMIHNRWGDGCNRIEANEAIAAGRAAIAKAETLKEVLATSDFDDLAEPLTATELRFRAALKLAREQFRAQFPYEVNAGGFACNPSSLVFNETRFGYRIYRLKALEKLVILEDETGRFFTSSIG